MIPEDLPILEKKFFKYSKNIELLQIQLTNLENVKKNCHHKLINHLKLMNQYFVYKRKH